MTTQSEVTASPVVAQVFAHVLDSIHDGKLQPGARISDGAIATEFGISRTPVREAIQMLRTIGVIEASANRFTRVAVVSPQQTVQAMTTWIALYGALVREVTTIATDAVIATMKEDHARFDRVAATDDYLAIASANFNFYERLRPLSANPILDRSITGVVHVIRLGTLHLPEAIDMHTLSSWQQKLIEALEKHNTEEAIAAIEGLRAVRIPQE